MVDSIRADWPGRTVKRPLSNAQLTQRREAAVRSGLYVRSPHNRRQRHYRAGRLLTRLLQAFARQGRPLTDLQIPIARAWCEFEVLAEDAYALLQSGGGGDKGLVAYLSIRRTQSTYAAALSMSPQAESELARSLQEINKRRSVVDARDHFAQYAND